MAGIRRRYFALRTLPHHLDLFMISTSNAIFTPYLESEASADKHAHFKFGSVVLSSKIVPVAILALHVTGVENRFDSTDFFRSFSPHTYR